MMKLEDSDPFFAAIEEIVEARSQRRPRVFNLGSDAEAAVLALAEELESIAPNLPPGVETPG